MTGPVAAERVLRVAPLGVRLWDAAAARSVSDGLSVTEVGSGRAARPTRGGVFVLTDVPGLGEAERGEGDEAYWADPPARRRLVLDVADRLGRFHAVRLVVRAPTRGVVAEDCGGLRPPGPVPPGVPLLSLPARPVPPGLTAVRADLVDAAGAPAAWCVLTVSSPGGRLDWGVADRRGRVLVVLPYPEPVRPPDPTPPAGSLRGESVPVALGVRYGRLPAGTPAEPPDLCALLTQPAAELHTGSATGPLLETVPLPFGRDLVLGHGRGGLVVTPAS